jgi:hypothetical protein
MADDAPAPAPAVAPEPVAAPPVAAKSTPTKAQIIEAKARAWQVSSFSNSVISRTPAAWALVADALPALIALLSEV